MHHILLVDDEPVTREAAVNLLQELGATVFETYNGGNALELLLERPEIEILIADIRMPGISGTDLAERARALRPDLRILLTSGYATTAPSGDFEFLPKPWRDHELRRVLDNPEATTAR